MNGYGRVKITTIQRAKDELRRLIQSEGTPAIQDAWDRLEQWIDAPPMMPGWLGAAKALPVDGGEKG